MTAPKRKKTPDLFETSKSGGRANSGGGSGETREAKIARLREAYRNGTYQVDAKELSAKIIDEHLK